MIEYIYEFVFYIISYLRNIIINYFNKLKKILSLLYMVFQKTIYWFFLYEIIFFIKEEFFKSYTIKKITLFFFRLIFLFFYLFVIFIIKMICSFNLLYFCTLKQSVVFLNMLFVLLLLFVFFYTSIFYNILFSVKWNVFNIQTLLYIDFISLIFMVLTCILIFTSLLSLLNIYNGIKYRWKSFCILLLILLFLLLCVFAVADLLNFYIFFEATLIPMFFILGIWGSRQRKIHAVYLFFFYTFIGSIFFLISIFLLLNNILIFECLDNNFLVNFKLPLIKERVIWFFLFVALCVKIPMFPFHIWLPEAHVEAPTIGSVILAGVLLKLGTYGMLRYLVQLFPLSNLFFYPFVVLLCLIAIIYVSYTTIRQIDLKKIIAYSSVSHMAYVILGLFSSNVIGLIGSIYLMISHGLVSGALFYLIGCLYHRYHTRIIFYYGGLILFMPIFSLFLLILTLANISFPGTSNFVGEFLILVGVFNDGIFICFIALFCILPGAIYSIWLFNRLVSGFINYKKVYYFSEISMNEGYIIFLLILLILLLGFLPSYILERLEVWSFYYEALHNNGIYLY